MTPAVPLAAAAEGREASPIALVIILALLVALVLLTRSMNKHLRRVPPSFPDRDDPGRLLSGGPTAGHPDPPGAAGPDAGPTRPADQDPT